MEQISEPIKAMKGYKHKILSLDGGGSKGAFTLGVLKRLEDQLGSPLCNSFDVIYGTSTGAIIAAYLALGFSVDAIYGSYMQIIPNVMSKWTARTRSNALAAAAYREFGNHDFNDVRCQLAIVATRCDSRQPLIFKSHSQLAHSQQTDFIPGFGVPLADCLLASSAASPFFLRQNLKLKMANSSTITNVIDGGFVANNPSLYALIDATAALNIQQKDIQLFSIGTGMFPIKQRIMRTFANKLWLLSDTIALLEETLESTANSADFIRRRLFPSVSTIRVNPLFDHCDFGTDLLESNPKILKTMYEYGLKAI